MNFLLLKWKWSFFFFFLVDASFLERFPEKFSNARRSNTGHYKEEFECPLPPINLPIFTECPVAHHTKSDNLVAADIARIVLLNNTVFDN